MTKKKTNAINISTHNHDDLYFAVGFSEIGKILRTTLPQKSLDEAISEISRHYQKFRVSNDNFETAKKLCDMYHGNKLDLDLEELELNINEPYIQTSTIKTTFERDVIIEVSKIPYGHVKSYKQIAKSLNSHAYRAVGTAIGKNPFPILVPCHRVIRSDGKIGGFRGGTQMKVEILKNEGIEIEAFKIYNKWYNFFKKNKKSKKRG